MPRYLLLGALLLLSVPGGWADAAKTDAAKTSGPKPDAVVTLFDQDASPSPTTRIWKFRVPPFGVEHQVRLRLEARIDWEALAGSNPWMRVAVNGHFLTRPDLLNKPFNFKMRNGMDLTWSRGDRWRVLYAPDFEAARKIRDRPYSLAGDTEPYRYVWDITRFVQPGENELKIYNLQVLAKPTTLVLRDGAVEVGPPIAPPETAAVQPAPTGPLPTFVAQASRRLPLQARLAPGAIRLAMGDRKFDLLTRTSLPQGKWNEASGSTPGAPITAGQSSVLSWKTTQYEVRRAVTVREDHVHVADTITNLTPELIGVIVEHRLRYETAPSQVFLAGHEAIGETASDSNGYNPSAFAQWENGGLGLTATDDVFRVHVKTFADADGLGLADPHLGIAPGAPVTLEWDIFPVSAEEGHSGDYWDFVNTVRRAWDANYPIPGPFVFFTDRPDEPANWYGEWARQRDVKIVAGRIAKYPNGRYAHGTGILHAPQWVAAEARWVKSLHETAPEVKALCYFHAQISTEPNGETKYAADRLLDDKGQQVQYPYRYPLPMYLPTRDNAYGKALWGFVHTILDDIHADGLYWDEMSHGVLATVSRAPWDGHTVAINQKTHAVLGQRTSVPLLMQPLKLDIIKYLRDHDKYLMANTQPMTRTMLQQKLVRFVETGTYWALHNTHLGCPLGLANHQIEATQADSVAAARHILDEGAVYYGHTYRRDPAPWNFTSVMYPITPARLGPGFVLGEERIHTSRSGRFGWPDGAAADVYVVNAQGEKVQNPQVREVRENGRRLYEIRMPSDHIAILVKRGG